MLNWTDTLAQPESSVPQPAPTTHGLVYTVQEAAELLGIHHDSLYRSIAADSFQSRTGKPAPQDALRWVRTPKRIAIAKSSVADLLGLTIAECDAYLATGAVPEIQQSRGPQWAARYRNWPRPAGD
jgi:hypothetical protein